MCVATTPAGLWLLNYALLVGFCQALSLWSQPPRTYPDAPAISVLASAACTIHSILLVTNRVLDLPGHDAAAASGL